MNSFRLPILSMTLAILGLYAGGCTITTSGPGTVVVGGACGSDLDCASGDFCDGASGLCVQDGTIAVGGYCNDDRDCAPGDACDGATRECVTIDSAEVHTIDIGAACQYDEECMPGDACDDSGVCVSDSYSAGSESTGGPCYQDADCASGYCNLDTDTCV